MSMTRQKWSVSAAAAELQLDRRRVAGALDDTAPAGTAQGHPTYWLADIVRALFDKSGLNPTEEKAKLDRARREKVELEVGELSGKLLDAEAVKEEWSRLVMNFRARMLALPTSLAPAVAVEGDVVACAALLKATVYEALTELSQSADA